MRATNTKVPLHYPLRGFLFIVLCLSIGVTVADQPTLSRSNPEFATGINQHKSARSSKSMVVTANPLATDAGHNVLARGGSAIDAAIAVQAMLTLVEPQSSGIGGGAFILHYDGQHLTSVDGRETAPAAATPDLFLQQGKPLSWRDAVVGGRSVGVPGVLRALELAHRKHGKLPWHTLFDDAINAAEQGFEVPQRLARLVGMKFHPGLLTMPGAKTYFYPNGQPLRQGDLISNREYAATLRLIATKGADAFYTGPLAEKIVDAVQHNSVVAGGLSLDDLSSYKAIVRDPVCGLFKAFRVCGMGPPTSGGIAVLQQLKLLEGLTLGLTDQGLPTLQSVHIITQAARLAFADRDRYVADPDFISVPVADLIDADYLQHRQQLIDMKVDSGPAQPGRVGSQLSYADDNSLELPSTSHISIADPYGNLISMTSSIETGFGSGIFVAGFLLNNQLTDFSLSPEVEGKPVANRVEAGKRPRSSMSPMVVFGADGAPILLLGSPGGSNIINYVTQALLGVLAWDMSLADAIAMPKFSNRNGSTALERGTTIEAYQLPLSERGHQIKVRDLNSGLNGIYRDNNHWIGSSDPRREGSSRGL